MRFRYTIEADCVQRFLLDLRGVERMVELAGAGEAEWSVAHRATFALLECSFVRLVIAHRPSGTHLVAVWRPEGGIHLSMEGRAGGRPLPMLIFLERQVRLCCVVPWFGFGAVVWVGFRVVVRCVDSDLMCFVDFVTDGAIASSECSLAADKTNPATNGRSSITTGLSRRC